ncbi:MAG: type II toxin-antitoxin system RelE/ParE family toxin [Micrococcales bacterium]|nr:type II toxin-antitoxin system RelE/ParE family toxin [Micrococcales bacterium]
MTWRVDTDLVEAWMLSLDDGTYLQVRAALQVLAENGPQLGRPLVDSVSGSRHRNMKELRPGSAGRSEIRILFAFDARRAAIMLLAGDKSGQWSKWYSRAVYEADNLFDQHIEEQKEGGRTDGKDAG